MIKIEFNEPDTQEWKKWRDRCKVATDDLISEFDWQQRRAFNANLYKGQRDEVYIDETNAPPFHGKCAYCEQVITGDQRGDIEHYRPKGKVTDAEDKQVHVKVDGQDRAHPGYYWLAYEWRNLLPACIRCNQLSKSRDGKGIGKGCRFPAEGDHAYAPGDEVLEEPLLLHPCIDDPEEHLELDPTGLLFWRTDRGRVTVEMLGLNERNLPESRKREIDDVLAVCANLVSDLVVGRQDRVVEGAKRRVLEVQSGKAEFSLAGRKAVIEARAAVKDFL